MRTFWLSALVKPEIYSERVYLWLGPVPLTRTMLTSTITSLLLVALCGALARAVVRRHAGLAAAAGRVTFGFLDALSRSS